MSGIKNELFLLTTFLYFILIITNNSLALSDTNKFDYNFLSNKDSSYSLNPRDVDKIKHYNWKEKLPHCFTIDIKDDNNRNFDLEFSLAFKLSTRFCIFYKLLKQQERVFSLSPQDLISCSIKSNQFMLEGNNIDLHNEIEYITNIGIVSENCFPFNSYLVNDKLNIPDCEFGCSDYRESYIKYKAYNLDGRYTASNPKEAQNILYLFGPVTTTMLFFQDLLDYTGGIYFSHEYDSKKEYYHAKYIYVTLIGWSIDIKYGKYWIVANNWGSQWGEEGYFRIPFEHCDIANNYSFGLVPNMDMFDN